MHALAEKLAEDNQKNELAYLIVFDNVTNFKAMEKYVTLFEASLNAKILVTTKDPYVLDQMNLSQNEVLHLKDHKLLYTRYNLDESLARIGPDDLLLLKWMLAFQQEHVSLPVLRLIIQANQQEKLSGASNKNSDENANYVLDHLTFSPAFQLFGSFECLCQHHLVAKMIIYGEGFVKLNCALPDRVNADLDRLKYRVLVLFSQLLEKDFFVFENNQISRKTVYKSMVMLVQRMGHQHVFT